MLIFMKRKELCIGIIKFIVKLMIKLWDIFLKNRLIAENDDEVMYDRN